MEPFHSNYLSQPLPPLGHRCHTHPRVIHVSLRKLLASYPLFLPSTLPAWDADVHARDAATVLAAKVKRYRFAAKGWKWAHRFTPYTENNCKFLLSLYDFFEESRTLSGPERALRAGARETLALAIKKNAAHWK